MIEVGTVSGTALESGLAAHAAGRLEGAREAYRAALAICPADAQALHLAGLVEVQLGRPESGVGLIRRSLAVRPGQAAALNSLGIGYRALRQDAAALAAFTAAAELRPGSGEILNNLGCALRALGRDAEAVARFREAVACVPGSAETWGNLAAALGGAAEAEPAFRRALALEAGLAPVRANFGRWLMLRGDWGEAERELAAASRLAPDDACAWSNLGVVRQELGRAAEAERCFRRAIGLDPRLADAHYNLGCLLHGDGRTDEAVASQVAAVAADPGFGPALLARCTAELPLLYASEAEVSASRQRYAVALDGLVAASRAPAVARALAGAIGRSQPFFLPYQGEDDRTLQAAYGAMACDVLAGNAPVAGPPAPGERIRLGIVSGYFCDHTLFRLFLQGWLSGLDRRRFEVIGLHTGRGVDASTAWAAAQCDGFVQGLPSADAWREAVAAIAPHALLYPEVGMDPMAAWLAAQRLARVQCVTWGQPVTTGLPTMDYFLSSDLMEPDRAEHFYTERLVRLPNLGACYRPEPAMQVELERAELGLGSDAPVYWSGQALYKYLPRYDWIFPAIAREVGACQFVFIGFAKSETVTQMFRTRLERAFAAVGLNAERHIVILPPLSQARYVAAVALADVILDTPGWSGGKSTLDCLGVDPAIVTFPGRFMRGRHTAAILRRIGCTATIGASLEEYVAIAARLGRDAAWRAETRAAVAAGKDRAFGDAAYLRALERFLEDAVSGRD